MLSRPRDISYTANAQPQCRLPGYPTFQLAPMAKIAAHTHTVNMRVRCLIVDDNRDFLHAARELLEREEISVVGVASTAAQACRICSELNPDVVLIDIDLGEESGFEVARQLAGQAGAAQPRLILISAYSGDDFEDMIADSPAVSFVPKASLSGTAIRGILADAAAAPRPRVRWPGSFADS
jgi:CheY-like chemotaxis protein